MTVQPLAISTGDPGGIGPEISLQVAVSARTTERLLLFGDAEWLAIRAEALGVPRSALRRFAAGATYELEPSELGLVDVGLPWDAEARAHRATARGGRAQLRALDLATAAALDRRVRALVTAPMSKAAVNLAGAEFTGHTEHLARAAGLRDDEVSMLFLGPKLRVALVTTHVSIARAPGEITLPRVVRTLRHMGEALLRSAADGGQARKLVLGVAGLNPHAGESGLFGDEELRVVVPAMEQARKSAPFTQGRIELRGPIPAETAFRIAASGALDGVVAMLHDQATIASKLLDWGEAVNVTWGLPFVRTSVDHGVAYDAAESGQVDHTGMSAALRMAQQLSADRIDSEH
jgi:4-hydroxythreonine-4-phosphate dehydrogenase